MTVRELIERLSSVDPDRPVLIEASEAECGFVDFRVREILVVDDGKPEGWWDGRYDEAQPMYVREPREPNFPAVVLDRDPR